MYTYLNDIKIGHFKDSKDKFLQQGVDIGFSNRYDGAMNVFSKEQRERLNSRQNLYRFLEKNDIFCEKRIFCQEHRHSCSVHVISSGKKGYSRHKRPGDGLVSSDQSAVLTARGCDCPILFMFSPQMRIIGIAHCGWRSVADGIVGKLFGRIMAVGIKTNSDIWSKSSFSRMPFDRFSAMNDVDTDMIAVIGPGICQKCFRVGENTLARFWRAKKDCERIGLASELLFEKRSSGYHIDLKSIIAIQLKIYGLQSVYISQDCTSCDQSFFSYRRDGEKNNQLGYISHIGDYSVVDNPSDTKAYDDQEMIRLLSCVRPA